MRPQRACLCQEHSDKIANRLPALRGVRGKPRLDRFGMADARLGPPCAPRRRDHRQRVAIDAIIAAALGHPVADVAERQFESIAQARRQIAGQPIERVGIAAASEQETGRPALAHAQRQRLDLGDQAEVALALGREQHVGQRLATQRRLFAFLERAKARDQPRLDREGREQRLAEAVDRLDVEPAAGRIDYLREQRPRALLRLGRMVLADRLQVGGERRPLGADPARQHLLDAHRHFGGARLGKGQAEDVLGLDPGPHQQPQDARGEHLRLARPRRCGQPDVAARIGGDGLLGVERIEALPAHIPYHSCSRISWS